MISAPRRAATKQPLMPSSTTSVSSRLDCPHFHCSCCWFEDMMVKKEISSSLPLQWFHVNDVQSLWLCRWKTIIAYHRYFSGWNPTVGPCNQIFFAGKSAWALLNHRCGLSKPQFCLAKITIFGGEWLPYLKFSSQFPLSIDLFRLTRWLVVN